MGKTIYIVNDVLNCDLGWQFHQRTFDNYIEAENYANDICEQAEQEYGTSIDREQNVYAVLTNKMQDWDGFVEITSVVLPSEEASEYNKQQKNIKEMEW